MLVKTRFIRTGQGGYVPYKSEKIRIAGTKYDRRIKLTEQDKEDIKQLTGMSIRGIARMYGVDKRLIQFILFPERKEKNLLDRKNRGGTMQYYNKDERREKMKEFRHYKQSLYLEGKIKQGTGKEQLPVGNVLKEGISKND